MATQGAQCRSADWVGGAVWTSITSSLASWFPMGLPCDDNSVVAGFVRCYFAGQRAPALHRQLQLSERIGRDHGEKDQDRGNCDTRRPEPSRHHPQPTTYNPHETAPS